MKFQDATITQVPSLNEGEVHLWWVSLSIDEVKRTQFIAELDENQRQRMQGIRSEKRKTDYIAGRGYLNQLLNCYVGKIGKTSNKSEDDDGFSVEIEVGEFGKPALRHNPAGLRFNYTDSGGYGLFAFALKSELGVDVESTERQGQFDRVIERRFAPQEQYLRGASTIDFLRCWTRKEAYGKAIAKGLNYPLREHVMCSDLAEEECVLSQEGFYGQQFSINNEGHDFIACLFSEGTKAKKLHAFHLIDAV